MVTSKIRKIWNQPMFQGRMNGKKYFEGWYYKIVDGTETNIHAFIPGISLGKTYDTSHAFIQWLNGITGEYQYFKFEKDVFKPSSDRFEVWVDTSFFSLEKMILDIDDQDHRLSGSLELIDPVGFPTCFRRPGIMGWYTFMPFMQCRHGIVSMNHGLCGHLEIDGSRLVFDGGKGYTEKDFGKSFPSAYIWMQCNHFGEEKMSFMCSVATVPFFTGVMTGYLCLFWYNGVFYNFSSYIKARIVVLESDGKRMRIVFEGREFRFEVVSYQDKLWAIKSPSHGELTSRTFEGLTSTMDVRLWKRSVMGWDLVVEDYGRHAGIEMCDDRHELVNFFNK